jgi:predicted secreted protein
MNLTREQSGETIALHQGEVVVLSLLENPSTGYRWTFAADGMDVAEGGYAAPAPGAVGGGGTRTVRLVAKRVGDAVVTATLQRSWEDSSKAVDRCEFRFKVS